MSIHFVTRILATIVSLSYILIYTSVAQAQQGIVTTQTRVASANLVVLQYHHVATDTPNSTSVTPATFAEHMDYLANNHKVIALDKAITAIQNNEVLPEKSVAITFDDGFTNILENAHPILQRYDFPYTVFINPALIGESSNQLSWDQVRQMQPLAQFANHTLDHAHLLEKYGNEDIQKWLTRVMQDVNQAEAIIREELGYSKKWLAYPYGEFNQSLKAELQKQGYIGFGQQSGAVSHFSDFGALPRFPAAGIYANLETLKVKLNSLAMPVKSIQPLQVAFTPGELIDSIVLEIDDADVRLTAFACYFRGEKLKFMGNDNKVTIKVMHKTEPGRARINCTAPSNRAPSRYYWYSYPMFTSTHDGEFLD
jgi:peptidoglycan/xylan/chitin deacetylase (PgdA/CDA1 family)